MGRTRIAVWLWFDVEKRYNTTESEVTYAERELWFDVEKRYNTTQPRCRGQDIQLWFDVEKRYNTTTLRANSTATRCGLM